MKLYCQPLKNLESFEFISYGNLLNINVLPFFNNNCNIRFNSLNCFQFVCDVNINLDILINICNNLDYMKFLINFGLRCVCEKVDKNYYDNLNEKLSKLKLEQIDIDIKNGRIIAELLNKGEYEEPKTFNNFNETGIHIKK